MSVLDVRAAIVAGLQATLGSKVTVESHRGRFDNVEEIRRFATRAPCVLVAALRIPVDDAGGGLVVLPAMWGAFVITRDAGDLSRGDAAAALAEAVCLAIRDNEWGRDDVNTPTSIDARNLYATEIDKLGVAMWGVGWQQTVAYPSIDQAQLDAMAPFLTFHQDIDMAPPDGAIDITETDTLPQ